MSIYEALDTILTVCIGGVVLAFAIAALRVGSDDR